MSTTKTHYIICFDVHDDKRRRRLVRWLETFSFRIQYSVFAVNTDGNELAKIREGIELATDESDSVCIFPINQKDWNGKIVYGAQSRELELLDSDVIIL